MDRGQGTQQNKILRVNGNEQPREQLWDLAVTEHCRDAFTILELDKNDTLIPRANTKKESEALSL